VEHSVEQSKKDEKKACFFGGLCYNTAMKIKRTTTRIPSGSNSITYECDHFRTTVYHVINAAGTKSKPLCGIYSFGRWTPVNMDRKTVADVLRHMKKIS